MAVYTKKYNGSAWVTAPVKKWNGSAWVDAKVQKWTGSAWTQLYPETAVTTSKTISSTSFFISCLSTSNVLTLYVIVDEDYSIRVFPADYTLLNALARYTQIVM